MMLQNSTASVYWLVDGNATILPVLQLVCKAPGPKSPVQVTVSSSPGGYVQAFAPSSPGDSVQVSPAQFKFFCLEGLIKFFCLEGLIKFFTSLSSY